MNSSPRPPHNFQFSIFNFQFAICNSESAILPSAFPLCASLCLFAAALFAAEPKFADVPAALSKPPANTASITNPPQAGLASTNAPRPSGTNSMEALDDKYELAIGDKLSFRIIEDEEDPRALFVTDSGELEVPYIGRYPAVNKTCKQLAQELKTELCKEYYHHATVIIAVDLMTKTRGKVYISGAVRLTGPLDIPSDETLTLSKAILRAGGFGDYADQRAVKITRKSAGAKGGVETISVDVYQILNKGKTDLDIPLKPGDLITVPEHSFHV